MKRSLIIAGSVLVLGVAGWAFRPDRLFINADVNESFPTVAAQSGDTAEPKVLSTGQFHGVAHSTDGKATVHELPDGKRVLRFTEFATSNGPELWVYLVAADDARDNATVKQAGFIPVSPLKGNRGDQNYDLPADVDLEKYRSVTVWCRRFSVNFATAPLMKADGDMTSAAGDTGQPSVLRSGDFHSVAHSTEGKATVYQLADGKRVLRFTQFATSNGPELWVYLVAADDAKDNATVKQAGFIPVAPLKGNRGDQNYELPADLDLEKYRSATIWCRRFSVNFATAPLAVQQS
jgi:hypothetical protein